MRPNSSTSPGIYSATRLLGIACGIALALAAARHTWNSSSATPTFPLEANLALPSRGEPLVPVLRTEGLPRLDPALFARALDMHEPRWERHGASDALHALRLWGRHAVFPDVASPPHVAVKRSSRGEDLLQFFLDESAYRKRFPNVDPLFSSVGRGLRARTANDPATPMHRDDFLAVAAEIGLSLKEEVRLGKDEKATVGDLLLGSFREFHPAQELEFTAVAYAHYLAEQPDFAWKDRFGRSWTLDHLARLLVETPPKGKACYGTHVAYSLALLWNVDARSCFLASDTRFRIEARLRGWSRELEANQMAAGFWSRDWCREVAGSSMTEAPENELVRATGHHLEWVPLVDESLRPSRPVIEKATRVLLQAAASRSPADHSRTARFNEFSHAVRAFVLISGHRFASDARKEVGR